MRPVSATTKRPLGSELLRLVFTLLAFSAASTAVLGQTIQVKSTIRVCVADENNPSSKLKDKIFVTLFNTASKMGKAGDDGCFMSASGQFDTNRTYFAVAVKDDKLGLSEFVLKNEDNDQVHTVDLTLKRSIKAPDLRPSITICAEDEDKNRVSVKDIVLGNNDRLNKIIDKDSGCIRVQLAVANDYQLNLVAESAVTSRVSRQIIGIPWLQLVIMIAILLATFGIGLILKNTIIRQGVDLEVGLLRPIHEKVQSISTDVCHVRNRVDRQEEAKSLPPVIATPLAEDSSNDSEDKKFENGNGSSESNKDHTAQPQYTPAPAVEVELANPQVAQAKQKYSDFIARKEVEFFFLMPVGESDASHLVAEARVKLREQNAGKYIAFCSGNSESEAWVFPKPNLHFTPETFRAVFPDLAEQDYQSGNIEPKRAVSMEPKLWRID